MLAVLLTGPAGLAASRAFAFPADVNRVMALVHSPHEPGWMARLADVTRITRLEQDVDDALLEALDDADATVRWHAALVLGRGQMEMVRARPGAIPGLVAALADPDPRVREASAWGLENARRHDGVEAALVDALSDGAARVRWAAAMALVRPGTGAAATPHLVAALGDSDARIRWTAARGLRNHRAELQAALVEQRERLQSADPSIRLAAAELLPFLDSAAGADAAFIYADMLNDPLDQIRQIGAVRLESILIHAQQTSSRDDRSREIESGLPALASMLGRDGPAVEPTVRSIRAHLQGISAAAASARPSLYGARWSDPSICLPGAEMHIKGFRVYEATELMVWDVMGEPERIIAGSETGYIYEYSDIQVRFSRTKTMILLTKSPSVAVGPGIRVGQTRQEVLAAFGAQEVPAALEAEWYSVSPCTYEDRYDGLGIALFFDSEGILSMIYMEGA